MEEPLNRPTGNYVVTKGNKTMVAWYSNEKFYIAGSHIPYTAKSFVTISEQPLELNTSNNIKATTW